MGPRVNASCFKLLVFAVVSHTAVAQTEAPNEQLLITTAHAPIHTWAHLYTRAHTHTHMIKTGLKRRFKKLKWRMERKIFNITEVDRGHCR